MHTDKQGFSVIKVFAHNGYITVDSIMHRPPKGISLEDLDVWAIESHLRTEVERLVKGTDTSTKQKLGYFVEYLPEVYLKESK